MNRNKALKKNVIIIIIGILFLTYEKSNAQFEAFEDIEKTTSSGFFNKSFKDFFLPAIGTRPFQLNSNLNVEWRSNHTSGADQIQPPSTYGIFGDLNLSFYNINLPFSMSFIGNELEYTSPNPSGEGLKQRVTNKYTRIGASPNYKWVTLHAGHRSFEMSEFTMQDLTILGMGMELNPGKIKFKYFNGRIANARPVDVNLFEPQFSIFERNGWGTQLGYGDDINMISASIFKAKDDQNSLTPDTLSTINPAQNTIIGIKGHRTIKRIRLEGEYGRSSYTDNILQQSTKINTPFPFNILGGNQNGDSDYKNAGKIGITYSSDHFSLGVNYKRVDEGYRSMGVAFFNNDIEEYSLSAGTQLFNSRLLLSGNLGIQNDNISNLKEQTVQRVIGDLNLAYSHNALSINLFYNNNSYSTVYLLNSDLDSLNAKIQTNVLNGNVSYTLSSRSGYSHTFSLNGTNSDVSDINGDASEPTSFYGLDFNYSLRLPSDWSFNVLLGYNNTKTPGTIFKRNSVGLGLTKTFISRISLAVQSNFIFLDFEQSGIDTNTNASNGFISLNYKINDQHTLYSTLNIISRKAFDMTDPIQVQESIFRIGYKFRFDYTKQRDNENE